MTTLAIVASVVALGGLALWWAARLGRKVGETRRQLEAARDTNGRLQNVLEEDSRVRRDIAAAGVYAPDEHQRD